MSKRCCVVSVTNNKPDIKWRIIKQCRPYSNVSNKCKLCLFELWSIRGQTYRWRQRLIQVFLNFWILNLNQSQFFAKHSNQSVRFIFFIDIRSRQCYFRVCQSGEISNKRAFFPCILIFLQIDSMLPCVCSVIDHRGRQNVVRTSVTHSAAPRVPLFCSYYILTSSVIYYWTDARQHEIYLLNRLCPLCKSNQVENEPYFLFQCSRYSFQRETFLNRVNEIIPDLWEHKPNSNDHHVNN